MNLLYVPHVLRNVGLTKDEIVCSKDEHPLELFRQGVRTAETQ